MKKLLIVLGFINVIFMCLLFVYYYRFNNLIIEYNDFEAISSVILAIVGIFTTIIAILLTYQLTNESHRKISEKEKQINTLESFTIINTMYGEAKNKTKDNNEYSNPFEKGIIAIPFTYDEYDLYKWNNEKLKFMNLWNSVFKENKDMDYFFNYKKIKYLKYEDMFNFKTKNDLSSSLKKYEFISSIDNFLEVNNKLYIFTNQKDMDFEDYGIFYNNKTDQGRMCLTYENFHIKMIVNSKKSKGEDISGINLRKQAYANIYRSSELLEVINNWNINNIKNLTDINQIILYDITPNLNKINKNINLVIMFTSQFLKDIDKLYNEILKDHFSK